MSDDLGWLNILSDNNQFGIPRSIALVDRLCPSSTCQCLGDLQQLVGFVNGLLEPGILHTQIFEPSSLISSAEEAKSPGVLIKFRRDERHARINTKYAQ